MRRRETWKEERWCVFSSWGGQDGRDICGTSTVDPEAKVSLRKPRLQMTLSFPILNPFTAGSSLFESQAHFCYRSVKTRELGIQLLEGRSGRELGTQLLEGMSGMCSSHCCCNESQKDEQVLWMGESWRISRSVVAGRERVIGQVPCKGVSCPEEVALSKAHSGMKEGDSGKALLQVFSYFCVGAKTVFPLTRQARRTLFWLLGTAASAAINAMAYANT